MKKIISSLTPLCFLLPLLMLAAYGTHAQNPCPAKTAGECVSLESMAPVQNTVSPYLAVSFATFSTSLQNIYNLLISFVGIAALGAMIYGGVLYITAAANPSKTGEARHWITNAILGLLVAAFSYVILYTINPDLIGGFSLPSLGLYQSGTGPGGGGPPGGNSGLSCNASLQCVSGGGGNNCFVDSDCILGGLKCNTTTLQCVPGGNGGSCLFNVDCGGTPICGDGKCDIGENCPADSCNTIWVCGDGICDILLGENETVCAQDCGLEGGGLTCDTSGIGACVLGGGGSPCTTDAEC